MIPTGFVKNFMRIANRALALKAQNICCVNPFLQPRFEDCGCGYLFRVIGSPFEKLELWRFHDTRLDYLVFTMSMTSIIFCKFLVDLDYDWSNLNLDKRQNPVIGPNFHYS